MKGLVNTGTGLGLACPVCKVDLQTDGDRLECANCRSKWPLVNGIPQFVDSNEYWGELGITRETAQEVNLVAAERNWREAIQANPQTRPYYPFISNLSRADWHRLLDLKPDSVVLDVGAGLGTLSLALAQHYARIFALERVEERVEFMRLRFMQEGCTNISIIKTDVDLLPFPAATFDLIILNGVLEWLPYSRKQESPRAAQLYYLRRLRDLLKPNGVLYVGIENRFCLDFLIGAPDPHIAIKGVTVLPRWVADLICRARIGDRYRPYLYSHRGYKKLLAEAGFRSSTVLSALPSYTDPRRIRPLHLRSNDFEADIWVTKNPLASVAKRILVRLDLLKYFGYAYVLLARN